MKIIESKVFLNKLWDEREIPTNDLLKIVVDIKRQIIALDAEMHADLEELLLEKGSNQENLWGANLYPGRSGKDFIEFTSFINIRPADGNREMEVTDPLIREKIVNIINQLIQK